SVSAAPPAPTGTSSLTGRSGHWLTDSASVGVWRSVVIAITEMTRADGIEVPLVPNMYPPVGSADWHHPPTITSRHPPAYSITSSARASTVAGMSKPSALAVLRLTTSVPAPAGRQGSRP